MRRAAFIAFAIFGQLSPLAAQAAGTLERIQAQLATPAVLCGNFDQRKQLVGLKKPVKSSGRFCVVVGKGILWRTLQPFPSTLLLTRDAITESRGGQVTQRLSAEQEPGVRVINDLLFALLAGDLSHLAGSFDVEGRIGRASWQATLAPRGAGVGAVISGIELTGGQYVSHVVIHEAGGDLTIIDFSALVTGAAAMQPDEARQFE